MQKNIPEKKLFLFDFDDCLVETKTKIIVKKKNGDILSLSSKEYAVYQKEDDDEIDYSQFRKLVEPKEKGWPNQLFKKYIKEHGLDNVIIITARATRYPVDEFIEKFNYPKVRIVNMIDSLPHRKAEWIKNAIIENKLDYIEFFDDSPKNVEVVEKLKDLFPNVKIITRIVE